MSYYLKWVAKKFERRFEMNEQTKKCMKCKEIKPFNEFVAMVHDGYILCKECKEKKKAYHRVYRQQNPEIRKAHQLVAKAIRQKVLIKQPCEVCGTTCNINAHHDDYSLPLSVRWLCVKHHCEHHAKENAQIQSNRKDSERLLIVNQF